MGQVHPHPTLRAQALVRDPLHRGIAAGQELPNELGPRLGVMRLGHSQGARQPAENLPVRRGLARWREDWLSELEVEVTVGPVEVFVLERHRRSEEHTSEL